VLSTAIRIVIQVVRGDRVAAHMSLLAQAFRIGIVLRALTITTSDDVLQN
jgi:hypothetical protein